MKDWILVWWTNQKSWFSFKNECIIVRMRTNGARAHLLPLFSNNSKNSKTWRKILEKIGVICIQVLYIRANSQDQMTFHVLCAKKTKSAFAKMHIHIFSDNSVFFFFCMEHVKCDLILRICTNAKYLYTYDSNFF